jgi:hypothetical protein
LDRKHTVRNESSAESSAFVVFAPGVEFERVAHGIELTRSLEEIR